MIMVDVEIEDDAWGVALEDVASLAEAAASAALTGEAEGEVIVLLTGDDAIAELNQRFRDRAGPTNVLSFPAAMTARPHLGDIALAFGVCAREARAQGKPLAHHLQHLVAHGALHLVGFDHQTDDEALVMEAREREILARLNVPDPYASTDDPSGLDTER